jgi:addiction module HigA family antidote
VNIFTPILNSPISYSTYAAVLQREDRLMTRKPPKRGLPPMHPGELLREEILPALDRSKTEIAKLLGISRQTLYDVLKEKQPVTPGMALRLGKLCGNGPDLWLNLQKRYDLRQAERELGEQIKNIPTLEVA